MLGCPICTKAAGTPFRVYDSTGKVLHGCVDAYHNGHLVPGTESARWHARPAAQQLRRQQQRALQSIGGSRRSRVGVRHA